MLCISMAGLAFAQINLVQNYSFENVSGTLECIASPTPSWHNSWAENTQEDLEAYWDELPPWTVPEMEILGLGAASPDHFCDTGNTGMNYGFGTNREYICAPLASNLIAGRRYLIEFYIKASNSLSDAGIRFSKDRPKQTGYTKINIDGQPHFEIDNNLPFSWNEWTRVRGFYTPDEDYTWLTIGTFDRDKDYTSAFAIDDIKIIEWLDECPALQLVENWNFDGFTDITVKGDDQLYAGYNVGHPNPNGDVMIPAYADISFKAGRELALLNGFGAYYESEFRAYIAPCASDCVPPDAFAGISQTICDGMPVQLGTNPESGYGYTWVASPVSATQYLSSVSVADPVFTPPHGEGDVTFYVMVVNNCGQMSTAAVTFHYDDTPSQTAQFSMSNLVLGDEPSFDLVLNADIEKVHIEVLDVSLNTVYYQEVFMNPIDFQCCSMPWALPAPLPPCIDYRIRITVTNFCTGATDVEIIDWNRNRTFALTSPIPNVITPNDDGINDRLCVNFTGAGQMSLEVKTSWGVTVFYDMITASPPMACIWDGECNQGVPACVIGPLEDGTYYYILKFFDCAGTSHDYTGFITLINGTLRMQQTPGDSTVSDPVPSANVFPNPSTGKIAVVPGVAATAGTPVEIYNALGEKIASRTMNKDEYVIEFDLSFAPSGIYYAHWFINEEMCAVRFVIQHRE